MTEETIAKIGAAMEDKKKQLDEKIKEIYAERDTKIAKIDEDMKKEIKAGMQQMLKTGATRGTLLGVLYM